jgi:hypothetical protein
MKNEIIDDKEIIVSLEEIYKTVCFEFCDTKYIPHDKTTIKKVIETLKSLQDDKAKGRNPHPLTEKMKNADVNKIIKTYPNETIISIDVGHRGGKSGQYRLLYFLQNTTAKIVALFIDTH